VEEGGEDVDDDNGDVEVADGGDDDGSTSQ
jgi:hypothetical protein